MDLTGGFGLDQHDIDMVIRSDSGSTRVGPHVDN